MGRRGPKAQAQHRYWQLARQGASQTEIARRLSISRQAVSRALKVQQREVLARLLEAARTSGALVEWVDGAKGVLVGIIPALGNLACIMVVDVWGEVKAYYDPASNIDEKLREENKRELQQLLNSNLGVWVEEGDTFRDILEKIIKA